MQLTSGYLYSRERGCYYKLGQHRLRKGISLIMVDNKLDRNLQGTAMLKQLILISNLTLARS